MRQFVVGILLLVACNANDDVPAPSLASVTPSAGAPGTIVQLGGAFLCQDTSDDEGDGTQACDSDGTISFGTTPADATSGWFDDGVSVTVPNLEPGEYDITASQHGRNSNSVSFTIE